MNGKRTKSRGAGDVKGLRDVLLGDFSEDDFVSETRDISVMTRLTGSFVEIIDALVKLEIFKSRSEAIASIIESVILRKIELFQQLKVKSEELDEIHDLAKSIAFKALTSEK